MYDNNIEAFKEAHFHLTDSALVLGGWTRLELGCVCGEIETHVGETSHSLDVANR